MPTDKESLEQQQFEQRHPDHDNPDHEIYDEDLQMISAFLDDQLSPEQKLAFKKRLLKEPKLNAQCHRFADLDSQIKRSVGAIDKTPPAKKLDKLLADDDPNQFTFAKGLQWAAVVAAVGLLSWYDFNSSEGQGQTVNLITDATLKQALNTQPALAPISLDQQRQFIVLQSFYHPGGVPCREYNLKTSAQKSHAIACRTAENWQIMINNQEKITTTEHYQTASTKQQDPVSLYLQQNPISKPMNTIEESKMIQSNWLSVKN